MKEDLSIQGFPEEGIAEKIRPKNKFELNRNGRY